MKILIIGDLHGAMPKVHFKKFDAIIAPGDFCSDKGIREYLMIAYRKFLKGHDTYPWWEIAGKKKARIMIQKSLKAGRKILERLNSYDVPVYVIPGNWDFVHEDDDWSFLDKNYYREYLIKGLKNVHDCHKKVLRAGEYYIIGYGLVNGPELLKYRHYTNIKKKSYVKNEKRYKRLVIEYDKRFRKAKKNIIFISHNVPYNTPLDKIVNKGNPMNGLHYGSNLARDMIEKHKPLICIAGHMHEHYGTCKIGKTMVLNSGFGGEKNTLLELRDGKIKDIKFYGRKK